MSTVRNNIRTRGKGHEGERLSGGGDGLPPQNIPSPLLPWSGGMGLMGRGGEVSAEGRAKRRPLHWAAINGHPSMVGLLLAQGADRPAQDGYERTPLHLAAWNGHVDVINVLLANHESGSHPQAELLNAPDKHIQQATRWS